MSFRPDCAEIEDAVCDIRGDMLLLELALERNLNRQFEAWELCKGHWLSGYHLFLLTEEQLIMLEHAVNRLRWSAVEAHRAINCPEAA